jgi:hypothetical protein
MEARTDRSEAWKRSFKKGAKRCFATLISRTRFYGATVGRAFRPCIVR